MTSTPAPFFEPPDLIAALPVRPFEFSAAACREADSIVAGPAPALFRRLICDQESESTWLVARRVLDAFLDQSPADDLSADEIAEYVVGVRPP